MPDYCILKHLLNTMILSLFVDKRALDSYIVPMHEEESQNYYD